MGTLHEDVCICVTKHFAEMFLEIGMQQTVIVKNIKTHFMPHKILPKNHTVYEMMWENMVQPYKPHMTT